MFYIALRTTPRPAIFIPPFVHPFSTTAILHVKTLSAHLIPPTLPPPYPYGDRPIYKQSNTGLYSLSRIRFGNHVSPGRNAHKTRRTWKPNVHLKKMYSAALTAWIKVKMTIRVFRTIKKEGSLDAYLLKSSPRRIKELGPGGWRLRWLVMQTEAVRVRYREDRQALGLPEIPAEELAVRNKEAADLVQIAVDYATPGPLSRVTRNLLAERGHVVGEEGEGKTGEEFTIGEQSEIEGAMEDGAYEKEYLGKEPERQKTE